MDIGEKHAHKVGQKKPNNWDLYDMHGNMWEWCQYRWDESGSFRVLRSGCWKFTAESCESSFRARNGPDFHLNYLGVRLAMSSD